MYGRILKIYPGSLAEELELVPGDKLLEINGTRLRDIIDVSFAFADEEIEMLVEHEYTECYLYYSMMCDETDDHVRKIFEWFFNQELGHLQDAVALLERYEHKCWQDVIPCGDFPKLLTLGENIDYVRHVLENTVHNTSVCEDYVPVGQLSCDEDFFCVQRTVNGDGICTPSHSVIAEYIACHGTDYRFQTAEHPICALADRGKDNTDVGRKASNCDC